MLFKEDMGTIFRSLLPDEEIVWSLPNFFASYSKESLRPFVIYSPWFSLEGDTWRLALILSSDENNRSNEWIGFFLWKNCHNSENVQYHITLGLKHTLDIGAFFRCPKAIYGVTGKLDCSGGFGEWKFMPPTDFARFEEEISPSGLLNFFCKIQKEEKTSNDSLSSSIESSEETEHHRSNVKQAVSAAKGIDRLIQDFKTLFLDGQNSDTILKAEEREFHVHRGIIAARSPVFASMFQHEMTEKQNSIVDIPDCSAEAFEAFLLYLYTGQVEAMSQNNVFNLYYASDKYCVDDLKSECVEFMKNTLSLDTFCNVLALSLRHSESELLKEATRFFTENVKKIIKTNQWQKFLAENPTQANELYIKAINA